MHCKTDYETGYIAQQMAHKTPFRPFLLTTLMKSLYSDKIGKL